MTKTPLIHRMRVYVDGKDLGVACCGPRALAMIVARKDRKTAAIRNVGAARVGLCCHTADLG